MTRTTPTARAALAALAAALVLAGAGCKKQAEREAAPAGNRPPPIEVPERRRGEEACTTYVERLCACAEQKPELAEQCHMKQAKPEALALALGVADDPSSTRESIVQAQVEARKIIARCIEEAARLPSMGCP
ncbi:MAG TPA: hypothetical protein VM734_16130 [Kofleriaceae bacterium]|jgi:hypothetical protein|nr:hypothetical protein [Kofleriaceae bacterium]